ncbi:S9 family peptidase [Shewanella intestini]|uniref:S9 family peptidase n=2 Tax=Shewanellaceae TaxID=267890 RepID=A0ABS5I1P6_9GAMM|nr:S9 family peptidase [Shewanella intestini]MRG35620.1 prolyl oligopeptidase family serine peptidase [Shewanella sp. XMDDZSB0408]
MMPIAMAVSAITLSVFTSATAKQLTLEDIMSFETLQQPVISNNGTVIAVEAKPDRGDSRVLVTVMGEKQKQFTIANGSQVQTSADGQFVMATIPPTLLEQETADKKSLTNNLIVLNTQNGRQTEFKRVKHAEFSLDGKFIAIEFEPLDNQDTDSETDKPVKEIEEADIGNGLSLIQLANDKRIDFDHVTQWVFDDKSTAFSAAINDTTTNLHQVKWVDLTTQKQTVVFDSNTLQVGHIAISTLAQKLAFTVGDSQALRWGREYQLKLVDLNNNKLITLPNTKEWTLNQYSSLTFSNDGERLFFGRVPSVKPQQQIAQYKTKADVVDRNIIVGQRNLRVWHGDDPKIKPQEVKEYNKQLKHTYLAVLHIQANRIVQLATKAIPDVNMGQQKRYLLASSNLPYQKMTTWAGFYRDVYLIDLNTGNHNLVLAQQSSYAMPTLSPHAKFVAYYKQGDVFLYDISNNRKHNLTHNLSVSFANEDHDYPSLAPGYGFGPWVEDDSGIVVYDKFDTWQFNTTSHTGFMLTNGKGRQQNIEFRLSGLVNKPNTQTTLKQGETLLLKGYSHSTKADNFYLAKEDESGVKAVLETQSKLKVAARASDNQTIVYTQQRYDQYPDLKVANLTSPAKAIQITELDKQRDGFAWGQSELVHWRDGDGKKTDGVLIKPTNYQQGKQYPVLVYFYRFMSDRLHAFPDMKINHRPNFAWYADNGYAIFLPDIRFEVGYPGQSAVKGLTSGVQKIIDLGIADPDAIGIQGHSWGGYQTAFAVTQTDIFKAAVSGAPVSNMTSAYSGIRHGSGLARQFQYETGQSRIGESLFKSPQKYIENSPIFYAERIHTPMMIMFGDKDDAVPWEQGIEMYLAMRRAGKDVVLLQYQDEPHHLKKYPNKLDYSIRMMEYFEHYLKGKPAPKWLTQGEAYQEYKSAN